MKHQRNIHLLWLLVFVFTACQPNEQNLPFETISQGDGFYTGRGYGEEEPTLLVIVNPDEVDKPGLEVQFPMDLADQLHHLDYDSTFAVIILQGIKGSTGYTVSVKQIVQQGNQVTIEAEFVEPPLDAFIKPAFTSPYHVVAVSKDGQWGQEVEFVLKVNGESVAKTTNYVP